MENIIAKTADTLEPFGRAERSIAAFCMAIPFVLIVADKPDERWWVNAAFVVGACFLLLPTVLAVYNFLESRTENAAAWTTIAAGAILYMAYLAFAGIYTIRPSISQYVDMTESHLFGLLLTVPGMLFIVHGFVYAKTVEPKRKKAAIVNRSTLNVLAGLALLGVVVIPYDWVKWLHYTFAILFYAFSAIVILKGMGSGKDPKTRWGSVVVMAAFMIVGGLNHFEIASIAENIVTLFGAESIGLWIIGVHYIIVSAEKADVPAEVPVPVGG
jgi:hypothetical protein